MRLAIGSDNAGLALKEALARILDEDGHDVLDLGTFSPDPVDHPDFARAVGQAVVRGFAEAGVLVCGSGVGASIAANKLRGVRAALCHDLFTARQSREDDDANVLCLGARVVDEALALEIARAWLAASFSGDERHARRLAKIVQMEGGLPPAEKGPTRVMPMPEGSLAPRPGADADGAAAFDEAVVPVRGRPRPASPATDNGRAEDHEEELPGLGAISLEDGEASPPAPRAGRGRRRVAPDPPPLPDLFTLPPVEDALQALEVQGFAERLWARDPGLWKGDAGLIRNRLGWLAAPEVMRQQADEIRAFADETRRQQVSHLVLVGMGGAVIAAEALARVSGSRMGFPDLEVADSTSPTALRALLGRLALPRTVFAIASKSGTTAASMALYAHFRREVEQIRAPRPGMQFMAITDPESPLEQAATDGDFRRIFLNPPNIGGRFSALSYFGLVPAALAGVDVRGLLKRAQAMAEACRAGVEVRANPGVRLGAALAGLAQAGRDKVTLLFTPRLAPFGEWIEQLLAGATGKDGKGLVPIDGEPPGDPGAYGRDRVFVALALESDRSLDASLVALADAGHPVLRLTVKEPLDLGGELFRWQVAAAAAAAVLGVNPFDDPEVEAVEERTDALLVTARAGRRLPDWPVGCEEDGILLMTDSEQQPGSIADGVCAHLAQMLRADYLAVLAHLPPSAEVTAQLRDLRLVLRDQLRLATTVGYGPRCLYTTGQLHNDGPPGGLFIQLTCDDPRDVAVPGASYGFSTFKAAQALAGLSALREGGRRVIRLHFQRSPAEALHRVVELVRSVTSTS